MFARCGIYQSLKVKVKLWPFNTKRCDRRSIEDMIEFATPFNDAQVGCLSTWDRALPAQLFCLQGLGNSLSPGGGGLLDLGSDGYVLQISPHPVPCRIKK